MSKKNKDLPTAVPNSSADKPGEEYKVGPGRPPREYQFKPGESGNLRGPNESRRR